MQINRLFEIVYLLMNKKVTTAKYLSEHFEVSPRTIYRDIEILCQAGIPIYTTKGKGGGIGIMDHFVLNKSVLSEQDQNDILSALQGLKATNINESDQVLSKLNSLFGNKNTDWIEVDFSYWNSTAEDKLQFRQLKEAILNNRIIEFNYFNSYGQESQRRIEPRKLIFKGQGWYLLGYCLAKKDMRYFKISRIKALQVLPDIFVPTPYEIHTDENTTIANRSTNNLVMKVDSEMAFRVFDEFPMSAITRNADGSFIVAGPLQTGWLIGYLMSFEDHIQILEPIELRDQLIQIYKNALNKYDT